MRSSKRYLPLTATAHGGDDRSRNILPLLSSLSTISPLNLVHGTPKYHLLSGYRPNFGAPSAPATHKQDNTHTKKKMSEKKVALPVFTGATAEYPSWRRQFAAALHNADTAAYEELFPPAASSAKSKKSASSTAQVGDPAADGDARLYFHLVTALHGDAQVHVTMVPQLQGAALWRELEAFYAPHNPTHVSTVKAAARAIAFPGVEGMREWYTNIHKAIDAVRLAASDETVVDTFVQEDLLPDLIQQLSSHEQALHFSGIVTAYDTALDAKTPLKWRTVCLQLQRVAQRFAYKSPTAQHSQMTPAVFGTTTSPSSRQLTPAPEAQAESNPARCGFCTYQGHALPECRIAKQFSSYFRGETQEVPLTKAARQAQRTREPATTTTLPVPAVF